MSSSPIQRLFKILPCAHLARELGKTKQAIQRIKTQDRFPVSDIRGITSYASTASEMANKVLKRLSAEFPNLYATKTHKFTEKELLEHSKKMWILSDKSKK